ncbi:MAG: hypothetical protein JWM59_2594 [Verrucomicrobiales bacterium]|nr:hypothetical protein [Verrucomicrobiales bacterium]
MMRIQDIFERDIARPINGVVKADQQDDASVWQELDEFVVTHELDKHLHSFFRSYLNVAENLNSAQVAGQIGVWISGFFGSGKSHFLKVLSYLMENRELHMDGRTKRTVDFFESKIKDGMFYADIRRALAHPTEVVLFNIETKADHASNRDAILSVLLRMLNELQGYAGSPPHIAHMERHLDERGKLEAFKTAFLEAAGKSWETERDAFDFYRDEMICALSSALGQSGEASSKWFDNAEGNFSLTVESFCDWVKEYLDSKGPDHRLLFFADEMGAFIGQNSQLMLSLQTITETLGTRCGGRAWVIVTSQEDIDAVIGVMNTTRANDFSRITARFTTRMSLSSANVDEVIRARLLAKTRDATGVLEKLHAEKGDVIRNQLTFGHTGMSMKSYRDSADFAATYPFIPYQFQLVQKIFEAIRKAGATGMHLARGERSLLDAFQSATVQIKDCPPGVLVPLYRFYPSIENFLDTAVKRTIDQASTNQALEPFDIHMLKVLFLIRYVDEVKGNVENLVALCMDEIDTDRLTLRRRIESSLLRLEGQTLVNRNGDNFSFLTNEERDLSREIKNQELDPGAEARLMGELIFDEVLKEQRKHRYSVNGKDFPLIRVCDRHPHGSRAENALTVQFITPLNDEYDLYDSGRCTMASVEDNGQVILRLGDHDSLAREVRIYLQTERFTSKTSDGTQNSSTQRILRDFADDNRQRRQRLVLALTGLVTRALCFVAGQPFQPKTAGPATVVGDSLDYLIRNTYLKTDYLQHLVTEPLKEIQAVLRANDIGQQTLALKTEQGNPKAIQELRDYLSLCRQASRVVVLHDLVEDRFSGRPYGWPSLETILLVARLLVTGEIHLVRAGAKIPLDRAFEELTATAKWRQITLTQRILTDPAELQRARKLGQEIFGEMGPDHEEGLCSHLRAHFQSWLKDLQSFQSLAHNGEYPGLEALATGIGPMQRLLAQTENQAFLAQFNASKDEILDLSESFHQLSNFYTKQRPLWEELRRATIRFRLNQLELERDPAAAPALLRMERILQAAAPYGMLSEARGLIDSVQEINLAMLSARRAQVLGTIEERLGQTKAELDQAGTNEPLRQEVLGNFDSLRQKVCTYDSIAHIDQAAREALDLFEIAVSAIEESTRKQVNSSTNTPKAEEQAGVKLRRIVRISSLLSKPFLESGPEVEDFLTRLRVELQDALAQNERIQIKE